MEKGLLRGMFYKRKNEADCVLSIKVQLQLISLCLLRNGVAKQIEHLWF